MLPGLGVNLEVRFLRFRRPFDDFCYADRHLAGWPVPSRSEGRGEADNNTVEQGGVMFARSFIFLYGIAAYVVFLAAFLYAIGFVGNLLVPKSIDTGSAASNVQAFIVVAILLGIFAIQHS